jgi:hypothetical protein
MLVTALSLLIIFFITITCLIIPGVFFTEVYFPQISSSSKKLSVALSIGTLFILFEFIIFIFLEKIIGLNTSLVIARFTPFANLALIHFYSKKSHFKLSKINLNFSKFEIFTFFLAFLYGLWSLYRNPWTMDNCLPWLIGHLNGDPSPITKSLGSPAFIAIGYFSSSLSYPLIPIITLMAPMKVLLNLLCALVCIRFVNSLTNDRNFSIFSTLIFIVCVLSFFGTFGLMETGKESAFGIAFLMLFFSFTFENNYDKDQNSYMSALNLSAAFAIGALSVPFGICGVVLLSILNKINFNWLLKLVIFTSFPLIISVPSLSRINLFKANIIIASVIGILIYLSKKYKSVDILLNLKKSRFFFLTILISLIIICNSIMPIHYLLGYLPLDGSMSFGHYLRDFDPYRPRFITYLGYLCIFYSLISNKLSVGTKTFTIFPFFIASIGLLLAKLDPNHLPFAPGLVWDWVKDVPNWLMPYTLGYIITSGFISFMNFLMKSKWHSLINIRLVSSFIVVTFFLISIYSFGLDRIIDFYRVHRPAIFYSHGGHENKSFSFLTNEMLGQQKYSFLNPIKAKKTAHSLGLCQDLAINFYYVGFYYYDIDTAPNINIENLNYNERLKLNRDYWACNTEWKSDSEKLKKLGLIPIKQIDEYTYLYKDNFK